jgi:hypothetical protein
VGAGEFGAGFMYATDSRFSEGLWGLLFGFTPEFGFRALFASNAILGLDDIAIEAAVQNAFVVSRCKPHEEGIASLSTTPCLSTSASLSSFTLFDTIYPVDQQITFSEGLSVGVQAGVPEPSSLTLVIVGALIRLSCICRQRESTLN